MTETIKYLAERALGETIVESEPFAGGFRLKARSGAYFLAKTGSTVRAEAEGLAALASFVKTPRVHAATENFLLLEWIETSPPTSGYWRALGESLADLHSANTENFGFAHDGFIGPTPQPNPIKSVREISWTEYFLEYRLKVMLTNPVLAPDALLQVTFTKCEPQIRRALDAVTEKPSLVHGDLWNGNVLCGPAGQPYLFDPAAYYGHREVDLAMSELFAGFAPGFYEAYRSRLPLAPGYEIRRTIYNLYHLLNHWILFGDSYRAQTMQSFSALK